MIDETMRYQLLSLDDKEKIARFNKMIEATFSHVDGRDLLAEIHPRHTCNITVHRRRDGFITMFRGDWLVNLLHARDGRFQR